MVPKLYIPEENYGSFLFPDLAPLFYYLFIVKFNSGFWVLQQEDELDH